MAQFERGEDQFSLEDQAFLKALGISGMSPGLEYALRKHQEALDARGRIETRADELQALDLPDEAVKDAARELGQGPADVARKMRLFRDLKDDGGEPTV